MYLAILPKAGEIVWDFRDDIAVLVSYRAGAHVGVRGQHLQAQLLKLSVVTVEENVPPQLFRNVYRAESTMSPKAALLG